MLTEFEKCGNSRTEEIQVKLRSERRLTRIPGCRRGSLVPAVMEDISHPLDHFEHVERVARFWRSIHIAWMGSLASASWEDEEESDP